METTPMLRQYRQIKDQYHHCILFFRLGDFYEMFGDDAIIASKILNITLTARNKGTPNETPMCGLPFHAAENYIAKLTKAGRNVAICEQMTAPNEKGIVDREVVRIITPGTTLDGQIISGKENNFLLAVESDKNKYGMAYVDLTTGEFRSTESGSLREIIDEISAIHPAETLLTTKLNNNAGNLIDEISNLSFVQNVPSLGIEKATEVITNFFKIKNLEPFGLQASPLSAQAAANLIKYLQDTQKGSLDHIKKVVPYRLDQSMILDHSTLKNLEIFYNNQTFEKEGSLLWVIDQTNTAMGGRLLRQYLAHPLKDKNEIELRLNAVDSLFKLSYREELVALLERISDIERIAGRIGCSRFSARDLLALKNSMQLIKPLNNILNGVPECRKFVGELKYLNELITELDKAVHEEPPALLTTGGMIKSGYNAELDQLRALSSTGKDFITQLQIREVERTGITSLKVKFNNIFGYYIEISKTNLDQVPADYERKQTLVNAERFTIPELKEYEVKILSAEDKIKELEYSLIMEIRSKVVAAFEDILSISQAIAKLDVVLNFAVIAKRNNYVKPEIADSYNLSITSGRHPVIESVQRMEKYIPNDVKFNQIDHQFILLTGPNMAGKSSYLRQIALITLMAQIGSFVPADSATIGACDRIFTRVGAGDNLSGGQSTFMVEMVETAHIINNATERSLIILDELGRGTSTYDGISIAWAVIEYIHNHLKSKTIFATHYHELIEMIGGLNYAKNYSIAVKEEHGKVIFLRKVVPEPISQSYGIEVAKLAGLPKEIIDSAFKTLAELESKKSVTKQGKLLL